jgi:guanylate kinase
MTAHGRLVVVSAPSGAGKTSIARELLRLNPSLRFSVSATTRTKRAGEQHGRDYYFLSRDEFVRKMSAGEFVEWEEIYGDFYGTLKSEVDAALNAGRHILFDVDVKGGLSIKRQYPHALVIFIRPPTVEVLLQRLRSRSTESEETLHRRMERVPMEMEHGSQFDYQVVNDTLERATEEVQLIVQSYLSLS